MLKNKAKQALAKISSPLAAFPENNVQIEGHTDNVPIKTRRFASNWELSAARSLSVLRYLLSNSKIDPARLSAAGYGEYHPIRSNDTPENKRLNRRVDIVIVPEGPKLTQAKDVQVASGK